MNLKKRILTVVNTDVVLVDTVAAVIVAAIGVESPLVLTALDGEATINAVFLIHCTFMATSCQLATAFRFFSYFVFVVASFQLACSVVRKSLDKRSWTFFGVESWSRSRRD